MNESIERDRKVYEALNTIKHYCTGNEDCEKCALSIGIGNKCVCVKPQTMSMVFSR